MNKRIENIDICRGILISLVVIGHIIPNKTWIYSFHVPAFFLLSGLLINEDKYRVTSIISFLKKKTLSLIIPYLFFEFLGMLEYLIISGFSINNLVVAVINTLSIHCNTGADWFLPTLFLAELLYFLFIKSKLFSNIILRVSIVLALLIIVFSIPIVVRINYIIVDVLRVLLAFAFLNVGKLLSQFIVHISKRINILCVFVSFIINIIICLFNGKVEMWDCEFGNLVLYLLGAVSGFIFVFCISKTISINFISKIGINSIIIIMGTHQLILGVFDTLNLSVYFPLPYLFYIFEILIVIIFEVFIILLVNKYLWFLVGKKKCCKYR